MRVLFAWELGDNYGHVLRQLPVIRALRGRGHDVLFVSKNVKIAQELLHAEGVAFMQAPVRQRQHRLKRDIASFAEILVTCGFAEARVLQSLTSAWHHLYRMYRPDVVVVDHAPAALLSARLSGIPVLASGTGFVLPPPVSPFPCFRPWLNLPREVFEKTEAAIMRNLDVLCDLYSRTRFRRLCDAMAADVSLLTTFPEIDHYPQRKKGRYVGPLFTDDSGVPVAWPDAGKKNIFAYLRFGPTLRPMLDALRDCGANVICAVPGIPAALKSRYESPELRIHASHVKLAPLLENCDLAVTYANHGTVSACLQRGIPQLMVPTQLEQLLLAERVGRSGAGISVMPASVPEKFGISLRRMLENPDYKVRAERFMGKYHAYSQKEIVRRIANTIEKLPAHVASTGKSESFTGAMGQER